jgi:hypothetical protein
MSFFVSLKAVGARVPDRRRLLRPLGRADGCVDWKALAPGYIIPGFAMAKQVASPWWSMEIGARWLYVA